MLNQIRVNHPDSIDTHALLMAAVEGMVRAADPHSYVLPAVRLSPALQEAARRGELHPVPVDFTYVADVPVVVSVHPGSKAADLDIVPGDRLVLVDGQPVAAESAPELDLALAGKKGSRVTLTLRRRRWDGSETTVARVIERERVADRSAIGAAVMLDSATAYIRLIHFASVETAEQFDRALSDLEKRGMRALILDVRDNGGGIVEEAARVAGQFLARGVVIYTSEGRKSAVADTVTAQRSPQRRTRELPMVVLVNGGTASAAEIVAGALQDHDRAWIVGRPTFGKSLLMQEFPMTDGSLIVLVVGHVKTPCGRVIQRRYRDVRRVEYFRTAGAVADTAGRPSCRTAGGRTVYGGGGIYPDRVLPEREAAPIWLAHVRERETPLRWAGTYLAGGTALPATPDEFAARPFPGDLVASFVAFATAEGQTLPPDAAAHPALRDLLLRTIAYARWGPEGYFTAGVRLDPEVRAALESLEEAERLLR